MADCDVSFQGLKRCLVEDLRDQAHVLEDQDLVAIGGCDARRLLAAVLEGIEAEVGKFCNLFTLGPNAEDATLILRALFSGQDVVI